MSEQPALLKTRLLCDTKEQLIMLMKRRVHITTQDASEELDLAVSTLRQHLMDLECDGFAESFFQKNGVGRPSKCYKLTEKADVFFVNSDRWLLSKLLRFLGENGDGAELDAFLGSIVEELIDDLEQEFDNDSSNPSMSQIREILESRGYLPNLRQREDGAFVVEFHHCPFATVAQEDGAICTFDYQLLLQLFDAAEIEHERDDEKGCCQFVVASGDEEFHHDSA
ncbi:MAG: helix-turn-helix transcriptional regulator [Persicimonas sp.]